MNQRDLNRAVACATGETISEIATRGFVPLTEQPFESEPLLVDWDSYELERNVAVYPQVHDSKLVGAGH